MGSLGVFDLRMLVAILAAPVLTVGILWLGEGMGRTDVRWGIPLVLLGSVVSLVGIAHGSRRAGDRELVSGHDRWPVVVGGVLLLAGICLPLWLIGWR